MTVLEQIVARTRHDLIERKQQLSLAALEATFSQAPRASFHAALCDGRLRGRPRLIAELKKASPSKGLLNPNFDAVSLARRYADYGAAALSVLTEPHFFLGSPEYLRQVHQAVDLPLLRKDFVIDPYQIAEARAWGASAVLLLVCLYSGQQLSDLYQATQHYGLDALVEVHSASELKQAMECQPSIIGINNRNLHDFSLRLETVPELAASLVDTNVLLVAESGYFGLDDVVSLQGQVDACLIGEGLIDRPAFAQWFA